MSSSRGESGLPRVVVLGGGMGGLVTAWELSTGDWRSRLGSITVYQRGWRLGGKGASSRGQHGRIEEHGLHVLLGYYDATFRVLREVYEELDREATDPGCALRTWREALVPATDVGLADWDGESWSHFVTRFSGNDALPGEPGAEDRPLPALEVAARSLRLLADFHRGLAPTGRRRGHPQIYLSASPVPRAAPLDTGALVRGGGLTALATLVEGVEQVARLSTDARLDATTARRLGRVVDAWRRMVHAVVRTDPALRRTWQLVDLVTTNLRGMAVDGLLSGSAFDRVDHLDYREWLDRHGAAPETLGSPIVRGMYDLVFAYEDGDRRRPRFAAGLGLELATRMLFDYKGSLFWRMQAGMGEVVFAPLYEALSRRGVEFRFLHRLDRLHVGRDRTVTAVDLTRQADLATGRHRYVPLVRLADLPCWPDRPLVDQLTDDPGDELESHWWTGPGAGRERLVAGRDFEVVVLAVSLGMVPHVAPDLVTTDTAWRRMVDEVRTVATQSAQLWLEATEAELGWAGPAGVTLSGFGDAFDTWASMSHLLATEQWPAAQRPRSLAYFCGALPEGTAGVRDNLVGFLDREVGALWPAAVGPNGFRWDLLTDGADRWGVERLSAQYVRANVDPSDRYVQSLPGSGRHRIAPGRTGFTNLAVAGDWTASGLPAGCLESATRSGVLAARAILGGEVALATSGAGNVPGDGANNSAQASGDAAGSGEEGAA